MNSLAPKFGSGTRIPTPLPPRCRPRQPAARGNGRLYRYTANAAQAGRRSGVSVVAASATSISAFSPAKYVVVVGRMRREKGEGRSGGHTRSLVVSHPPIVQQDQRLPAGRPAPGGRLPRPGVPLPRHRPRRRHGYRTAPGFCHQRRAHVQLVRRFTRDDSLAMIPCW